MFDAPSEVHPGPGVIPVGPKVVFLALLVLP